MPADFPSLEVLRLSWSEALASLFSAGQPRSSWRPTELTTPISSQPATYIQMPAARLGMQTSLVLTLLRWRLCPSLPRRQGLIIQIYNEMLLGVKLLQLLKGFIQDLQLATFFAYLPPPTVYQPHLYVAALPWILRFGNPPALSFCNCFGRITTGLNLVNFARITTGLNPVSCR